MSELQNFDFNNVEDFKGRIEPGVEECEIVGILNNETKGGSSYVEMGFITTDKQREHKERFYISSDKAVKMTMLRFKHLIKVLVGEEKSKNAYSFDQLNQLFTGLKGRFLFFGEEYVYENDGVREVRVRTNLAFLNFVEPLSVTKENSKLRYDPNNKNHLKKLPIEVAKVIENDGEETTIEDDVF